MKNLISITCFLVILNFIFSCKNSSPETENKNWKELTEKGGFLLDIRYATENNFTKKVIYPCGRCFLRPAMAAKIIEAQKEILKKENLRIKLFDCYRPRPAQQRLWDVVPDSNYVSHPSKGSMHNRGLAIDLTLVDSEGNQLDMGTDYDYFGKEAHIDFAGLPESVLKNRQILFDLMKNHGLSPLQTEWWHFSLSNEEGDLSDWEWDCSTN